ncbi:conserved hypothetical protein [Crocosphaera subtropica ATCC 51142]|uniref:DUF2808 domain-containing protein n=1 Tax=Crocosphaera subtropica (strain ATCC 51142 / BH68) TaxID=43989 RepID=B1WQ51_CROS5|nr:DUF2808 domain-containing protein [Crocosphaera subtropica]ACB49973.1 conserved hypothetical protein [Crocosphaera subtropica ATCC 51142]
MFKTILGIISSTIFLSSPLLALNTGNNLTLFNKSPRLLDAVTTLSRIRVEGATYYFTVHLPTDVGESLQQLTIQQTQGLETIYFYLDDTIAFEGRPVNRDGHLNIARVKRNLDNNTIAVIFDPPIPPGKTFTIAMKPKSNPEMSGDYQFAITAYPAGENAQGLYLGLGRFNFNQKGDRFP